MALFQLDDQWNITLIDDCGRGGWEERFSQPGFATFEGFGGENMLTISLMGMQDQSVDILVLHGIVDSPHEFKQQHIRDVRGEDDNAILETKINRMVEDLFGEEGP